MSLSFTPLTTSILIGASRLGIDPFVYRREVDAGNRWCSGHRQFEPRSEFGPHKRRGLNTVCLEFGRINARVKMARLRASRKAAS